MTLKNHKEKLNIYNNVKYLTDIDRCLPGHRDAPHHGAGNLPWHGRVVTPALPSERPHLFAELLYLFEPVAALEAAGNFNDRPTITVILTGALKANLHINNLLEHTLWLIGKWLEIALFVERFPGLKVGDADKLPKESLFGIF